MTALDRSEFTPFDGRRGDIGPNSGSASKERGLDGTCT